MIHLPLSNIPKYLTYFHNLSAGDARQGDWREGGEGSKGKRPPVRKLHLKTQQGVKWGEKTGKYTDKCAGRPARMVQAGRIQLWDPAEGCVQGEGWSKHHKSDFLGQTWWFWLDMQENQAARMHREGKERQQQEPAEGREGGEPEPRAATAGNVWLLKGRRQILYVLGEKRPLPLCYSAHANKATAATGLRPLTYRFLWWGNCCLAWRVMLFVWTSGELGSSFTNFFLIYVSIY